MLKYIDRLLLAKKHDEGDEDATTKTLGRCDVPHYRNPFYNRSLH